MVREAHALDPIELPRAEDDSIRLLVQEFLERRRKDPALTPASFAALHPHAARQLEPLLSRAAEAAGADSPADATVVDPGDARRDAAGGTQAEGDRTVANESQVVDGRYEVVRILGQGGFGRVILVRDLLHGGELRALKLILPEHSAKPEFASRFQHEIRVLRALSHQGIPQIFNDGRTAGGEVYYTMAFVEGRTLSDVLRKEAPLGPERVVHLVRQMLDTLAYAHEKGVVHRDLKPANIMLVNAGTPGERVKILDFGIAKVLRAEGDLKGALTQHTVGGIGTPHYMSPEQVRGQEVDERSDLYSLGIIVYQMCSGILPFRGKTDLEIAAARLERNAILPEDEHTPPWLRSVVDRLLERERERRPSTQELAKQFEQVAQGQRALSRRITRVSMVAVALGLLALPILWQRGVKGGPKREALPPSPESTTVEIVPATPVEDPDGPNSPPILRPEVLMDDGGPSSDPPASESIPSPTPASVTHPVRAVRITDPGLPEEPVPPGTASLVVEGAVDRRVSRVTVNGEEARLSDGRFRCEIALSEGKNEVEIVPYDTEGRRGEAFEGSVHRQLARVPEGCESLGTGFDDSGRPSVVRHRSTGITFRLVPGDPSKGMAPFYLGETEVTRGQYLPFASEPEPTSFDLEDGQPVVNVSSAEADSYCQRFGFRLPSSEEWERAARGPEHREYPWGDSFEPTRCAHARNGPVDVGLFPGDESAFGLRGMAGNVSEWCWQDARGKATAVRGGSFTSAPEGCRLGDPKRPPRKASEYVGFRVALEAP